MPTLTDANLLAALAAKVSTMQGTATEIAAELNGGTVTVVRTITTDEFLEAVSPANYAKIVTLAAGTATGSAEAKWLLQALDAGQVSATAGTRGRTLLELLLSSGILSAAESQALIAAATEETQQSPSWGEAAGIGYVYPEFVEQVMN
jgi:hypothetical protein